MQYCYLHSEHFQLTPHEDVLIPHLELPQTPGTRVTLQRMVPSDLFPCVSSSPGCFWVPRLSKLSRPNTSHSSIFFMGLSAKSGGKPGLDVQAAQPFYMCLGQGACSVPLLTATKGIWKRKAVVASEPGIALQSLLFEQKSSLLHKTNFFFFFF